MVRRKVVRLGLKTLQRKKPLLQKGTRERTKGL